MISDEFRKRVVDSIVNLFISYGSKYDVNTVTKYASEIDEICVQRAIKTSKTEDELPEVYNSEYKKVFNSLKLPYGIQQKLLLQLIIDKYFTISDLFDSVVTNDIENNTPMLRIIEMAMFKILSKYQIDVNIAEYFSKYIIKGCYNVTIQKCISSKTLYIRQWNSPIFLNIFNARAGIVMANLDLNGQIYKNIDGGKYASTIILDIYKLIPKDIEKKLHILEKNDHINQLLINVGKMTSTELCPKSSEHENTIIKLRLNQPMPERTSVMFKCPRCKLSNCSYRMAQIAASDESQTALCRCNECGHKFSQS